MNATGATLLVAFILAKLAFFNGLPGAAHDVRRGDGQAESASTAQEHGGRAQGVQAGFLPSWISASGVNVKSDTTYFAKWVPPAGCHYCR